MRNGVIVLVIVAVMGMILFLVNDPYGLKVILLLACVLWAKPFVFLSKIRYRQGYTSAVGV